MAELGERGARDHGTDLRCGRVATQATGLAGERQTDAPAAVLDRAPQGAVVDDLRTDGREATQALERLRPNENAAAGGRGNPSSRGCDPRRRIKFEKEEHERRNQ